MGHVYFNEKKHENAYILYLKFLTLFVEKVRFVIDSLEFI